MPGMGLPREAPAPIRFIANHVFPHVIPLLRRVYSPNVHTVEESGDALGRLATDPELADTTRKYFEGHREIPLSDELYDDVRAEELWNGSLALTARP
jgi:hypothetical protein